MQCFTDALAITDAGQIIGEGVLPNCDAHQILLTPNNRRARQRQPVRSRSDIISLVGLDDPPGSAGGGTRHAKIQVKVEPDGEPAFEATFHQGFSQVPWVGQKVTVIYDPQNHSKICITRNRAVAAFESGNPAELAGLLKALRRGSGITISDNPVDLVRLDHFQSQPNGNPRGAASTFTARSLVLLSRHAGE